MKLYNQLDDKIENLKVIYHTSGNYVVDKLDITTLNTLGYYPIVQVSPPDRRYYTATRAESIVGENYEISYTPIEKPLAVVQDRMLDDLRDVYNKKALRPRVDTGLGYDVYGSQSDIAEFVDAKDNAETEIVDADNNIQSVTGVSYTTIADAIKADRAILRATGKTKVAEIKAFTTIQECIDYEHEAYDYTITQEDIDNNPEAGWTLGEIITRYRDNITDW